MLNKRSFLFPRMGRRGNFNGVRLLHKDSPPFFQVLNAEGTEFFPLVARTGRSKCECNCVGGLH